MTVAVLFDEGRGFAEDEISGLYADCYAVRLYFTNNNLGN
jgi:hypothetical protein